MDTWLTSIGLPQYAKAMAAINSTDDLFELLDESYIPTEEQLVYLTVANVQHRKHMEASIRDWARATGYKGSAAPAKKAATVVLPELPTQAEIGTQ